MKKKLNLKKIKFPVSKPYISQKNISAVNKTLKSGWISSDGPEVKIFEKKFSKFVNRKFSTSVSSGTAALEIAIKALGIKKNDEVLIPNFTIISNALAVIKQNAIPVPIDCNLENWNIDLNDLKRKITSKTKAIIITHIYSFSNDLDEIFKLIKRKKIYVIEDAAEVLGLKYKNKKCGSFGDISTFSFYANKQITTGEGGMISTNNSYLNKKCQSLRNLSFGKIDRFNHDDIGWNYRMTNIQASLGISQLKEINKIVKRKMSIGRRYYEKLKNNSNLQILPPKNDYSKNIYWVVGVVIKSKKTNYKILSKKLLNYGIGSRPFFWPMSEQTVLKRLKIFRGKKGKFPNSNFLSKFGIYLPSYFNIKNKQIDYICNVLIKCIK